MASPTPPAQRRRFSPWLILAAVVLVVAVVVTVIALQRRTPTAGGSPSVSATAGEPTPTSLASSPEPTSASPTAESPSPSKTKKPTPTPAPTKTKAEQPPTEAPTPTPQPKVTTKSPVPIDKKSKINPSLTAGVSRLESVEGKGSGPGETGGPSIRVTLELINNSDRKLDLSNTVVNLYYGKDERPASLLSGPGVKSLPTSLPAGAKAGGRFVFNVPKDGRATILITVDYSVKTPVVAFRGAGPS